MPNNLFRKALKAALKTALNEEQPVASPSKGTVTVAFTSNYSSGGGLYSVTVSVPGLKDVTLRNPNEINQYIKDAFGVEVQVPEDIFDRPAKEAFRNTLKQVGVEVRETEMDVS